jgi:hypothetical protein
MAEKKHAAAAESAGSIDPGTGHTRVEHGDAGPTGEDVVGDTGVFTNARSAEGGEDAPQPIIDPADPYNRDSDAGSGDKGTTTMGAGTTAEEVSPAKAKREVAHPPTDAYDPDDASAHPAGDTKTTTAEDPIDASDSVAAGVSHPVETESFATLMAAQQAVPPRSMKQIKTDADGGFSTSVTGTPRIGEQLTAKITGVSVYDKVWLRVKGPDADHRTRMAHEGDSASQSVMITRPGTYAVGFEVNTKVVGNTEFVVE